jgi:hypothetical protein
MNCWPELQPGAAINKSDLQGTHSMSADHYRRMATQCIDLAQQMSARVDRARLMEMASGWLRLAEKGEADADNVTAAPKPPAQVVQQPQQQQGQQLKQEGEKE